MNASKNLKQVQEIELGVLLFDEYNPRFGGQVGKVTNQTEILDLIVNEYGIDDVLSSLAVNGYFSAEPIIVREIKGSDKLTVVEGNRRLAACLILAQDPRAKNQALRYENIKRNIKHESPNKIPVIRFELHEDENEILSYLGVRHIAAAQPWDSYAKAAWVARVINEHKLTLEDVISMVGEKTGTIQRMLEGYYFITQLIEAGKFNPQHSYRKGRGSNTNYPFSWIYTLLGYPPAKNFLSLPSTSPQENPIPPERLDDAGMLVEALFGNSNRERRPAIDDSRRIGNLASLLDNAEKIVYLRRGNTVAEIEKRFTPLSDQLSEGLTDCVEQLALITSSLVATPISPEEAAKFLPLIIKVRKLAKGVHDQLQQTAETDEAKL